MICACYHYLLLGQLCYSLTLSWIGLSLWCSCSCFLQTLLYLKRTKCACPLTVFLYSNIDTFAIGLYSFVLIYKKCIFTVPESQVKPGTSTADNSPMSKGPAQESRWDQYDSLFVYTTKGLESRRKVLVCLWFVCVFSRSDICTFMSSH